MSGARQGSDVKTVTVRGVSRDAPKKKVAKNSSDPKQVEDFEQHSLNEEQILTLDYDKLMKLPEFRRFIWRELARAKIYNTTFTGNSATYVNEGRRQIGLELLAELEHHCPGAYAKLMQENFSKEEM